MAARGLKPQSAMRGHVSLTPRTVDWRTVDCILALRWTWSLDTGRSRLRISPVSDTQCQMSKTQFLSHSQDLTPLVSRVKTVSRRTRGRVALWRGVGQPWVTTHGKSSGVTLAKSHLSNSRVSTNDSRVRMSKISNKYSDTRHRTPQRGPYLTLPYLTSNGLSPVVLSSAPRAESLRLFVLSRHCTSRC